MVTWVLSRLLFCVNYFGYSLSLIDLIIQIFQASAELL